MPAFEFTRLQLMNNQRHQFTSIKETIDWVFDQTPTKQELREQKYDRPLKLGLISKGALMLLTDLTHSIQAVHSRKQKDYPVPCNRKQSGYYAVATNNWIALNSPLALTLPAIDHPHAYQPQFHFPSNYEEYCKERPKLSFSALCESAIIRKWKVRLVNISSSGYYGIVLELEDWSIGKEKSSENLGNVSSLIYEEKVMRKLEQWRMKDLRNHFKMGQEKQQPWSLFYHCRDLNLAPTKNRLNILAVDTENQLLRHSHLKQKHLIPFGEMQGILCLKTPMKQATQTMSLPNQQQLQLFFNVQPTRMQDEAENHDALWETDSQSNQSQPFHHSTPSDSQSNESDDPLRSLYIKQFASLHIS